MSQNFSLNLDSDIHKYKKKKNNSSKSNKRSDHKHKYETVIMKGLIGWIWCKRCVICGRIGDYRGIDKCFLRPEYRDEHYICEKFYYSCEELQEIYPNIKIFESCPWDFS